MEIEKKFLIKRLPNNLGSYPHTQIKQGYISTSPVIRIRQLGDNFILTIKGKGLLEREEYELNITKNQFQKLSEKVEGTVIDKTRYYIPYEKYTIELDLFHDHYQDLQVAEVEFETLDDAHAFSPPEWFGEDVTHDVNYQNSTLSQKKE
jgi:CYTH domain-containing protein